MQELATKSGGRSSSVSKVLWIALIAAVIGLSWKTFSRPGEPRGAGSIARASAPSAPPVVLKSCFNLGAKAYEQLSADYVAKHPEHAEIVKQYWRDGTIQVGIPEAAFAVIGCFWITDVNVTETGSHVRKQVVISEDFPSLGRYVYIENGVVVAIQR